MFVGSVLYLCMYVCVYIYTYISVIQVYRTFVWRLRAIPVIPHVQQKPRETYTIHFQGEIQSSASAGPPGPKTTGKSLENQSVLENQRKTTGKSLEITGKW